MITQNPVIGRSRKKLAGVYARTFLGKNILQSCPSPSRIPPSQALKDSRTAFAIVTQMANMLTKSLLTQIYYLSPIGRTRRQFLTSQLFTGVQRLNHAITFNIEALSELGSNPVVTTEGLIFTIPAKSFSIPLASFAATSAADQSRLPCILAISYELGLCVSWLNYTVIDGTNLAFSNISDTFLNQSVLLLPLWQTNVNTQANPVWVFGSFKLEQ